jgi:hypothetical protein
MSIAPHPTLVDRKSPVIMMGLYKRSIMKHWIELIFDGWCYLTGTIVFLWLLCFLIFGGEIHAYINWNSFSELIKALRR